MTYTVLARKYRPQTFDELVGQEHVARTIGNAIANGRVAHAFLFTGVRGVGKTTTARLLAKSLNCETGPSLLPCNTCGPCVDITAGRDVDVQEIDGASNNSVDDVRRLQETLPFRPSRDRFKIVIVDEVHMLSTGAFNAFLKTLEEPPSHVKFIFATTESHKVPVTIRSRCQRYDFRLIPQGVVAGRVRAILEREGLRADDAAVKLVAREAAGSMRDALTLLDQIVAFAGQDLEGVEIARQLGVAGREHLENVLTAVLTGDARAALVGVNEITQQGVDPLHFSRQLVEMIRDLAVFRAAGADSGLVDWVDEDRAFAERLLEGLHESELSRVFAMVAKVVDEVARASSPATALEMGMLRIASRPALRGVDELLARLDQLEAKLRAGGGAGGGGTGPGGAGTGGGGRGAPPASRGPGMRSADEQPEASAERHAENTGRVEAPPFVPRTERAPSQEPQPSRAQDAPRVSGLDPAVARAIAIARGEFPSSAPEAPRTQPAVTPPARPIAVEPAVAERIAPQPVAMEETRGASVMPEPLIAKAPSVPPTVGAPVADTLVPDDDADDTVNDAQNRSSSIPPRDPASVVRRPALLEWAGIVKAIRTAQPALGAMLEHGVPRIVTRERIVLGFQQGSFYGRQVDQPETRATIIETAARLLGGTPELEVRFDVDASNATRTVAAVEAQRRDTELEGRRKRALEHPAVLDAFDVFPDARSHADVRFEND